MPEEELDASEETAQEGGEVAGAAAGEPTAEQHEAEQREAMRRLEEEIGRLTVADHLLLMLNSLSSLAIERMGLTQEGLGRKDLDQVRLAIDAFKALLGVLEGRRPAEEMTAHRAALSQLQLAYVSALGAAPTGGGETP